MNANTTDQLLPTEIAPADRLLTAAEFQKLADVPPEVEWFANLDNPNTRRSYENGLDPTFVSPAAKLVLGRFWGRFRQRKSQIFDEKRVLSKVTAPASRHFAPSPPKFAPVRPAKCQKCPPQSCLCSSKSPLSEFFPKWRLVTRMLGLARISQQTKCIGAANQRKVLLRQRL